MKIFVVVPIYNVEDYIVEFLDSLMIQEYKDVVYVLVNDGSTDTSGLIARSYASQDKRFHLIEQNNAGVSAARNTALNYVDKMSSSKDYVVFFDPDDYLTSPNALKDIANELKKSFPDLLIYNHNTNDALEANRISTETDIQGENVGKYLYPATLFDGKINGISLSASLFRSAFSLNIIIKNHLRFREDIRKSEDTLWYARFLTLTTNARLTRIIPYNYRIRPRSLTTTYRQPSRNGVEKGLSILSEFRNYAFQRKGMTLNEVDKYFRLRYIQLIINFSISMIDHRSKMSLSQIKSELDFLYNEPEILQSIKEIKIRDYNSFLNKIQIAAVKSRIGVWVYGIGYNAYKLVINKI